MIDSGLWDCSLYSVLSEILLPANLLSGSTWQVYPPGDPLNLHFDPTQPPRDGSPQVGCIHSLAAAMCQSYLTVCLQLWQTMYSIIIELRWINFHFMDDFARQGGGPKQSSRSCTGVSQRCGAWRPFGHSGWGTHFSFVNVKCLWPPGAWLLMDIVKQAMDE